MTNKKNNENELREQEAPLKNTDNAFVRVNHDGQPEMPLDMQGEENNLNEKLNADQKTKANDK